MVKISCDICGEEITSNEFGFEASLFETIFDIQSQSLNTQKRMKKTLIQVCEKCYKEKIGILFNNYEKNKPETTTEETA